MKMFTNLIVIVVWTIQGALTPRAASLEVSSGTHHHVSFTGHILANVNKHHLTAKQLRFAIAASQDQQQSLTEIREIQGSIEEDGEISQKTGERLGVF